MSSPLGYRYRVASLVQAGSWLELTRWLGDGRTAKEEDETLTLILEVGGVCTGHLAWSLSGEALCEQSSSRS